MFKRTHLAVALLATASLAPSLAQAELFTITVSTTGNPDYVESFNSATNSIDAFDTSNLQNALPTVNWTTDAALGVLDYRGLEMRFEYVANSSSVLFSVPSLGISQTFNGATRDDSTDQLADFLESDGGSILNQINKALASVSPNDPIAGNPDSLMATQVSDIFSGSVSSSNTGTTEETFDTNNSVDLSLRFGSYQVNGKDVQSLHLPLGYTFNIDSHPGHKLQIKMPLSYSRIEGEAETYSAGLGIAYTIPYNDKLAFTPSITYGAVGSIDLGTAAALETMALTTRYDFEANNQKFRFGNTFAHVRTLALTFDKYSINPDLKNTVMVNGITWYSPKIKGLDTEVFFTDTRYFGDQLYSERTNEIGAAITTPFQFDDFQFKLGVSYLFADKSDLNGFRLNVGSSF